MPLKPSEIMRALDQKQAEFKAFDQTRVDTLRRYRQALAQVSKQTDAALDDALLGHSGTGAKPLEALGRSPHWIIAANLKWSSREQSLEWVRDRLTGVTTFAVDGSQIFPSKEVSIPVALVQVGWFENPHLPLGTYDKDVRLNVLSPADLKPPENNSPLDLQVSMYRFQMEVQRLIEFMENHANQTDCLVFFDGSLVVTFAEALTPDCREFYVQQVLELLRTSERQRVPLVAYIDTSYARDLVRLLQHLRDLPDAPSLYDAFLLGSKMQWGDRTPLFRCDRQGEAFHPGILRDYQEQSDAIAFTYLKANDRHPVRLEFPVWLYEAGLIEKILEYIRGEIIIGNGYPYVIETADQAAVLQSEDRQIFYRLLQEWAAREDIDLRFSRKMVSKMLRRR